MNKIRDPISTNIRCFIKKKYEFVSNLSEAINDVETNEKNKPNINSKDIISKIILSIFFHQLYKLLLSGI